MILTVTDEPYKKILFFFNSTQKKFQKKKIGYQKFLQTKLNYFKCLKLNTIYNFKKKHSFMRFRSLVMSVLKKKYTFFP